MASKYSVVTMGDAMAEMLLTEARNAGMTQEQLIQAHVVCGRILKATYRGSQDEVWNLIQMADAEFIASTSLNLVKN